MQRTTTQLARRVTSTAIRAFSSAEPATDGTMSLNFNLPHETIYTDAKIQQVIVPGAAGEFGVTADHVPVVAELKPGLLQIMHEEGSGEPEKYFVAGGFSVTHANSTTDISCPEAVKVDDLDSSAVTANFEAAKSAFAAAESGSLAQAEAQIDMEVNKSMGSAIGLSLA